jgi:glucose-6-phosphate isomerase
VIQLSGSLLQKIDRSSEIYRKLSDANLRLARKDATLWGEVAKTEAAIRLNWVNLPESSRELLPTLDALSAKFRGREVILCGMGGSSLAPEVIAGTYKKSLFVFDLTDPNYASHVLKRDLKNSIVVVSSKSGSTIETASQRAAMEGALKDQGLDPRSHLIFVTDPNSPLDQEVRANGFTVINADPNVGGRFSALTAFGLVPAALIGVDVSLLLDSAAALRKELESKENLAIDLAYLLYTQSEQFVAFADSTLLPGLSDWIEQLVAESTGKDEKGRLPIVLQSAAEVTTSKELLITFDSQSAGSDLQVIGELGEQFLIWEWTTALLGVALEIDPFNQPNVTEAKIATSELLKEWHSKLPDLAFGNRDGQIEIAAESVKSELSDLISKTTGYIAILAYLDRKDDVALIELRKILAEKSGKPVTFGWGPRFQHSTGQFHKAGQPNGSFLIVTGSVKEDFVIPEREFTFQTLVMAQALGEFRALSARKYPVSRVHLHNRAIGISELLAAAKSL